MFWTTDLPGFSSRFSYAPSAFFTCPALPQNWLSFHHGNSGTCNRTLLSWNRGIARASCKLILNHAGVHPFFYRPAKQSAHTDFRVAFHLFLCYLGIKSVSLLLSTFLFT